MLGRLLNAHSFLVEPREEKIIDGGFVGVGVGLSIESKAEGMLQ